MERKPLSFLVEVTVTGGTIGHPDGSGSNTTPTNSAIQDAGGYLRQIIVKPPFPTTIFNFRIENENSHNILKRTDQEGEIVEDVFTPMPAGTYTLYFENCSHPGTYEVEIIYAEVY